MGAPALTEAFCRSDEVVYNEYSPDVVFHRGSEAPNTIARGASRCQFVFDRVRSNRRHATPADRFEVSLVLCRAPRVRTGDHWG